MAMTSKPRKYGFIAWLFTTIVGLLLSFLSKSSVILGLALTFPLMVPCLSVAIQIWIRNGYRFWIPQKEHESSGNSNQSLKKELDICEKMARSVQGRHLSTLGCFLSLFAWVIVLSPVMIVVIWGSVLIYLLDRDIIGLAVIMAGTALLLAFYSIILWWRTQWQSSRAVAYLLLLAVSLLCSYELCDVYVTAGVSAVERYSPSGFFFGVSAIALAIILLFICRMVFNGTGLDVDEYVMRSYKFAYSDCIEVGPFTCSPEPPDPNDTQMRKSSRVLHLALLYLGSLVVLLAYSLLYGLTANEEHWLGAITSAAVIVLDWNMGACLLGFKLIRSRYMVLFVAGTSRIFLICFGIHYWYLGHCASYAVVASVLLGAAVSHHLSFLNPLAARQDALRSTVIRLREGFRWKGQSSSSSSSEGCGSSVKRSSSSVEGGQHCNAIEAMSGSNSHCVGDGNNSNMLLARANNCREALNFEKSIDVGGPSVTLRSNSCSSVIRETDVGVAFSDKHLDQSNSLVVCSSSGLESQSCESNSSCTNLTNQHALDFNLATMVLKDRLNDPRVKSMLKIKGVLGDHELADLLQDKGLDLHIWGYKFFLRFRSCLSVI